MPTKVKGMTSIEIAILVAIVLVIAVAVGWYLYTTFAASVGAQPVIRVLSATAWWNGTIIVKVANTGSTHVNIIAAEVFGEVYRVRGGFVVIPPGGETPIYIDTGRWIRQGSLVQGRLITEGGQTFPFTARTVLT
jgi:uncharacterized protein (UPF0333 family)